MLDVTIHKKIMALSWRHRGDFDAVVKAIQQVFRRRALPEDSPEYALLEKIAIPTVTAFTMTKRWGTLEYDSVRCWGDAVVAVRAWQRSACEVSAQLWSLNV